MTRPYSDTPDAPAVPELRDSTLIAALADADAFTRDSILAELELRAIHREERGKREIERTK